LKIALDSFLLINITPLPNKIPQANKKILDYVNDIIRLEEIWIVSIGEKRKNPPHWRVFRSMKFRNYYSGITTVSIT